MRLSIYYSDYLIYVYNILYIIIIKYILLSYYGIMPRPHWAYGKSKTYTSIDP